MANSILPHRLKMFYGFCPCRRNLRKIRHRCNLELRLDRFGGCILYLRREDPWIGNSTQDNAELRAQYIRKVPTFTAADIHKTHTRLAVEQPGANAASRWRREKRVFAVAQRPRPALSVLSVRRRPSAARRQAGAQTSASRHDIVADRVLVPVRQRLARRKIARRSARRRGIASWMRPTACAIRPSADDGDPSPAVPAHQSAVFLPVRRY